MNLLVQSDRILDNFRILQKQAGRTPLLPLLEANAYGFGDAETARLLAGEGVGALAVSRLEEGIRVAEAVRGVDILLMTPYAGEEDCLTILKYGLIAAVGSNDSAVLLSSLGRQHRMRVRIQLCFDFGMGRFGFEPQEAAKAAQTIKHLENVELCGVFTVLPSGDCGKAQRQQQGPGFPPGAGPPWSGRDSSRASPTWLTYSRRRNRRKWPAAPCGWAPICLAAVHRRIIGDLNGWAVRYRRCAISNGSPPGCTAGDDGRCRIRRATRVAVVPAGLADGLFTDLPEEKGFLLFPPAALVRYRRKKSGRHRPGGPDCPDGGCHRHRLCAGRYRVL